MRIILTQYQLKRIESKTKDLVFELQCILDQNIDDKIIVEEIEYAIDRVRIATEVSRKLYFTTK